MKKRISILSMFIFMVAQLFSQGQDKTSFRDGISVSPQAGLTYFYGDAGPRDNQSFAYGFTIDKEFFEKFGVKLSIDKGNLKGTYELHTQRIYEGKASYLQYGLSAYFNLSNLLGGYYRYRKVFINLNLGGGLMNYDEVNRYLEGAATMVYEDGTTGEDHGQVPFTTNVHNIDKHGFGNSPYVNGGLMLDYKLSHYWYVRLDANLNYLFTSRVDGVEHYYYDRIGNVYYDPNDQTGQPFKQKDAFGPVYTKSDYFYSVKIGIKYRFSYKKRNVNTGTAKPSKRSKYRRLPSNQFFENLEVPGTNAPKVIQ